MISHWDVGTLGLDVGMVGRESDGTNQITALRLSDVSRQGTRSQRVCLPNLGTLCSDLALQKKTDGRFLLPSYVALPDKHVMYVHVHVGAEYKT